MMSPDAHRLSDEEIDALAATNRERYKTLPEQLDATIMSVVTGVLPAWEAARVAARLCPNPDLFETYFTKVAQEAGLDPETLERIEEAASNMARGFPFPDELKEAYVPIGTRRTVWKQFGYNHLRLTFDGAQTMVGFNDVNFTCDDDDQGILILRLPEGEERHEVDLMNAEVSTLCVSVPLKDGRSLLMEPIHHVDPDELAKALETETETMTFLVANEALFGQLIQAEQEYEDDDGSPRSDLIGRISDAVKHRGQITVRYGGRVECLSSPYDIEITDTAVRLGQITIPLDDDLEEEFDEILGYAIFWRCQGEEIWINTTSIAEEPSTALFNEYLDEIYGCAAGNDEKALILSVDGVDHELPIEDVEKVLDLLEDEDHDLDVPIEIGSYLSITIRMLGLFDPFLEDHHLRLMLTDGRLIGFRHAEGDEEE